MKSTIPLGRYSGVPVGAHWSVLFTVALLADLLALDILPASVPGATPTAYWLAGAAVTVLFMISVLAHEIAHAAVGRRFGARIKSITLWMLGGSTVFEDDPPTPRADAFIASAGPATSAALGGICLAIASLLDSSWLAGLPAAGFTWLALVNLLLAGFNLLPAAPLDGGRLLRAWLWKRFGDRERASGTAGSVGQTTGILLIVLGFAELLASGSIGGLWLALIGWYVYGGAATERVQAMFAGQLREVRVGDVATPHPVTAAGWLTVEAFLDQLTAQGIQRRVFPVVDFSGAPVGVLSLRDLLTVRPDHHRTTRVQDAARPLGSHNLALAGEPLTDLLRRTVLRSGRDAVVVLRDRQLAGIVTEADISRTLDLARLGRHPSSAPVTP